AQPGEGVDQHVDALLRHQPAGIPDPRQVARARIGSWLEEIGVDAELRDDLEPSAIALAPQYLRSVVDSRHRRSGHAVVSQLEEPEGWRVAAVEVLPGEEDHARADHAAQHRRVEGHRVVRLLVDMEDVRAEVAHDPAEPWIEMNMVAAV